MLIRVVTEIRRKRGATLKQHFSVNWQTLKWLHLAFELKPYCCHSSTIHSLAALLHSLRQSALRQTLPGEQMKCWSAIGRQHRQASQRARDVQLIGHLSWPLSAWTQIATATVFASSDCILKEDENEEEEKERATGASNGHGQECTQAKYCLLAFSVSRKVLPSTFTSSSSSSSSDKSICICTLLGQTRLGSVLWTVSFGVRAWLCVCTWIVQARFWSVFVCFSLNFFVHTRLSTLNRSLCKWSRWMAEKDKERAK